MKEGKKRKSKQPSVECLELKKKINEVLVSKGEAALLLGVSVTTITNYSRDGRLHKIKIGGDSDQSPVRFKRDEVLSLMNISNKTFLSSIGSKQG